MSLTIELTPAEESAIRAAAREGIDVTTFVRKQIVRATHPVAPTSTDLVAFLQDNGNAATRVAREKLHTQGIGYVVTESDGAIVERLPDVGTNALH